MLGIKAVSQYVVQSNEELFRASERTSVMVRRSFGKVKGIIPKG